MSVCAVGGGAAVTAMDLVPHAEYMDVAGARHMVAGDRNDRFSTAILGFLGKLG